MAVKHANKEIFRALDVLINDVIPRDETYQKGPPIPDNRDVVKALLDLHSRYILVVNRLTKCHDEMINFKCRKEILHIIEQIFGRILELKQQIVDVERTDFIYAEDAIEELQITRKDLEILIPKVYRERRVGDLAKYLGIVRKIYRKIERNRRKDLVDVVIPRGKQYKMDDSHQLVIKRLKKKKSKTNPTIKRRRAIRKFLINILNSFRRHEKHLIEDAEKQFFQSLKADYDTTGFRSLAELRELVDHKKLNMPNYKNPFKFYSYNKAVNVIKKHERARVGKAAFQRALGMYNFVKTITEKEDPWEPVPEFMKNRGSEIVQRYWYLYRRLMAVRRQYLQKAILCGYIRGSDRPNKAVKSAHKKTYTRKRRQMDRAEKKLRQFRTVLVHKLKRKDKLIATQMRLELLCYMMKWLNYANEYQQLDMLDNPPLFPTFPDPNNKIPIPARILGIPEGLPKDILEKNFKEIVPRVTGKPPALYSGTAFIEAHQFLSQKKIFDCLALIESIKKMFERGLTNEERERVKRREKAEKDAEKARVNAAKDAADKLEELKKLGYLPIKSTLVPQIKNDATECLDLFPFYNTEKYYTEYDENDHFIATNYLRLRNHVDKSLPLFKNKLGEYMHKETGSKKKFKPAKIKVIKEPKKITQVEKTRLIKTLAKQQYLQIFSPKLFKDLPGHYCLHSSLGKDKYEDTEPCIKDIYQIIKETCVLPLASLQTRQFGQFVRSVLLLGPRYLTFPVIQAICTETGALMIYLHPINSNRNWNYYKLVNTITKAANMFSPVVIYVEQIHLAYFKSVPEHLVKDKPAYLSGVVGQLMDAINKNNQVLFIASTDEPESADEKRLFPLFSKIIPWPQFDQAFISSRWQKRLMKIHLLDRFFPYTQVAEHTIDFDLVVMPLIMKKVMTVNRMLRLNSDPLTPIELLRAVPKLLDPAKKYWEYAMKTVPLYQQRKALLQKTKELKQKQDEERALRERKEAEEEKKRKMQKMKAMREAAAKNK